MGRYLLGILVLSLSLPVLAVEAGKVVLSLGKNTAQLPEQKMRFLKRQSVVFSQDVITTGEKGRLQLRFTDGSRLSLRSSTQFRVEEYIFDSTEPTKGKSIYRLLKGGMRTITGAISDTNVEQYRVNTPIATIGVRGTHYELFFCDKACAKSQQGEYGLYGHVLEGTIFIAADDQSYDVSSGKHFFLGANQTLKSGSNSFSNELSSQDGLKVQVPDVPAVRVNPVPDFEKNTRPNGNRTPSQNPTGNPNY